MSDKKAIDRLLLGKLIAHAAAMQAGIDILSADVREAKASIRRMMEVANLKTVNTPRFQVLLEGSTINIISKGSK